VGIREKNDERCTFKLVTFSKKIFKKFLAAMNKTNLVLKARVEVTFF
jgi:hypothetical protein